MESIHAQSISEKRNGTEESNSLASLHYNSVTHMQQELGWRSLDQKMADARLCMLDKITQFQRISSNSKEQLVKACSIHSCNAKFIPQPIMIHCIYIPSSHFYSHYSWFIHSSSSFTTHSHLHIILMRGVTVELA